MEVVVPSPRGSPTMDHFDFSGGRTSPYLSAPSSPKRFGEYYLSAPTSPSRFSEYYSELEYFSSSVTIADAGAVDNRDGDDDDGFAFFVNRESDKSSRSAEELFDGGKIKPLELEEEELFASAKSPLLSPKQPNRAPISQGKKTIREAFSPRKKKESGNHLATAADSSKGDERRGRDRTPAAVMSSSKSGRRVTRSHSPYRISPYTWEEEQHPKQQTQSTKEESSNPRASLSSSSKSSRKWRLRDFLLFRSASEGRGSSKDPFRKYPVLFKKPEEVKNPSFRSSDNNTTSAPGSRRKGPVSAHELHYAKKKAESEDLRKRTFLPYKQGILGRLAGLGSLAR